jgi:hypothetical protein
VSPTGRPPREGVGYADAARLELLGQPLAPSGSGEITSSTRCFTRLRSFRVSAWSLEDRNSVYSSVVEGGRRNIGRWRLSAHLVKVGARAVRKRTVGAQLRALTLQARRSSFSSRGTRVGLSIPGPAGDIAPPSAGAPRCGRLSAIERASDNRWIEATNSPTCRQVQGSKSVGESVGEPIPRWRPSAMLPRAWGPPFRPIPAWGSSRWNVCLGQSGVEGGGARCVERFLGR